MDSLSPTEAVLMPWLEGNERLLWIWDARRAVTPVPSPRGQGLIWMACTTVAAALLAFAHTAAQRQRAWGLIGLCTVVAIAMLTRRFGSGRPRMVGERFLRAMAHDNRPSPPGLYGLTQRRILALRDGGFEGIPLIPGEPVIQYGALRVDRPDHRGRVVVKRIPRLEQDRLFTALKLARALREELEIAA